MPTYNFYKLNTVHDEIVLEQDGWDSTSNYNKAAYNYVQKKKGKKYTVVKLASISEGNIVPLNTDFMVYLNGAAIYRYHCFQIVEK